MEYRDYDESRRWDSERFVRSGYDNSKPLVPRFNKFSSDPHPEHAARRNPPPERRSGDDLLKPDSGMKGRERRAHSFSELQEDIPSTRSTTKTKPSKFKSDYEQIKTNGEDVRDLKMLHDQCVANFTILMRVCERKEREQINIATPEVTFEGIKQRLYDDSFRFESFGNFVDIHKISRLDDDQAKTVKLVKRAMRELLACLTRLDRMLQQVTLRELNAINLEYTGTDNEDDESDDEEQQRQIRNFLDPPGTAIMQQLHTVEACVRALTLLTEPFLNSITPNPYHRAVTCIVADTARLFGDKTVTAQLNVDENLFGAEALTAARESAKVIDLEDAMEGVNLDSGDRRYASGPPRRQPTRTPSIPLGPPVDAPVYVKVHRQYLDLETLTHYELPWDWDRDDPHYIVILKELDTTETETLFEHTRRLRQTRGRHLFVEEKKPHPQYAWVRKKPSQKDRVRSKSRDRASQRAEWEVLR